MPNSVRFNSLVSRLAELRRSLLPRKFDPTGTYPNRVVDRTLAYQVLVHAELEACLEDLVFDLVENHFNTWVRTNEPTRVLMCLLAFHASAPIPQALHRTGPPELHNRLDAAREDLCSYVRRDNHGLREHNVLRMLLPVGVREADIDNVWLQSLNSFSRARGAAAHQSKAKQPPDPRTEYETVKLLVKGLKQVDSLIQSLA